MTSNSEFISLNQGVNFDKKTNKSKLKKKFNEGFTSPGPGPSPGLNNTEDQAPDLNSLTSLQTQYSKLLTDYDNLTSQITHTTQENMNRLSGNNPYLGKNITLDNSGGELPVASSGVGGYVSNQGILKSYPNAEIYNATSGKNGCPTDFIQNVKLDDYSKTLVQGPDMVLGQSCGNENSNVYVSSLNNNPSGNYIGCYNNKPESSKTLIVPKMNYTNKIQGFTASATSTYQNNNKTFGPWAAFDNNINTFWHSTTKVYNGGRYTGKNRLSIFTSPYSVLNIQGEILTINMPSPIALTSYEIKGRQDCCGPDPINRNERNPQMWYLAGYNSSDKKWYYVDGQNIGTTNINTLSFDIKPENQKPYNAYALVIVMVMAGGSDSVQISQWNLYIQDANSSTSNEAMIDSKLGYTTLSNCQSYALDNNYQYYAMQGMQSNSTATCLVSNDKTQVISYGPPEGEVTLIPLWASNTANTNYISASISNIGQITLADANGNVKTVNDAVQGCTTSTPCTFHLLLDSNSNMILYNGDPDNNNTVVFSTQTSGQQQGKNMDWIASKGKYGKPYLLSGQSLSANDWIGSADGSLKLLMQTDGNLVLYTSVNKKGCVFDKTSKQMFGTNNVNAVYQLDNNGYSNNLGNLGYIDKNTVLHKYPSSMIGYSNEYTIYNNFDSKGNDISQVQTADINSCKEQCNNYANNGCAGFVFQKGSNICYLKDAGIYPKSARQSDSSLTLGVRTPSIINGSYSNAKINMIDSIQYQNYPKGDDMSASLNFNAPVMNENIKNQMTQIQNQLTNIGGQIADKMEELYRHDKDIVKKMNMNDEEFKKQILMYKSTDMKSRNLVGATLNSNSKKVEGMQNLGISDINGMLMDSDLHILQENYGYIFWSILAVGLLSVTVNVMKKSE